MFEVCLGWVSPLQIQSLSTLTRQSCLKEEKFMCRQKLSLFTLDIHNSDFQYQICLECHHVGYILLMLMYLSVCRASFLVWDLGVPCSCHAETWRQCKYLSQFLQLLRIIKRRWNTCANFCHFLATSFIKSITLLNSVEKLTTFHAKIYQFLENDKRDITKWGNWIIS